MTVKLNSNSKRKKSSNPLKEVINICVPYSLNQEMLVTCWETVRKIKSLVIRNIYQKITKN